MCSHLRHSRRFALALPAYETHVSTFLPPFPVRGFANPRFTMASRTSLPRRLATCGTTKALTPTGVHFADRSPRLPRQIFPSFRLQPRHAPRHRFIHHDSVSGSLPGFAKGPLARRHITPNRVRHPTDRQFASRCSPLRLATTQLLSATELWQTPTRTYTVLIWRHHGRTIPAFAGMTDELCHLPESQRHPAYSEV